MLTEGSGGYREDEGEGGKDEGLGHTGGQEDAGERDSSQGNHDWSWEQAWQIQEDQGSQERDHRGLLFQKVLSRGVKITLLLQ